MFYFGQGFQAAAKSSLCTQHLGLDEDKSTPRALLGVPASGSPLPFLKFRDLSSDFMRPCDLILHFV